MPWLLENADAVYKFGVLIGGAYGLFLAARRVAATNQQAEAQIRQADAAARQADLGRQKLVGDLFNQAVGQLRDEKLEVRLFAVYTLRRIGTDFPEYQTVVLELFASFVRENQTKWGESGPPVDVLEIMKVLETSLGDGQ